MLHINIICIGKLKEQYLKDALNEYSKRLYKYCSLKIIELPDEKVPENLNANIINKIKEIESNNILSHIKNNSYTIALDLHGKQLSSEEFSLKIENIALNNNSNSVSKRKEIKELIKELKKINPSIDRNIFTSMNNVNLNCILGTKKDGIYRSFLEDYEKSK